LCTSRYRDVGQKGETTSEGERRKKRKEVASTSIPFFHSPLIRYFILLIPIGFLALRSLFVIIILFVF
jgi:hypothetical protein